MRADNERRQLEAYLGARHYYNISGAWDVPHDGPVELGVYDVLIVDECNDIWNRVTPEELRKRSLLLVTPLSGFAL